MADWRQNYSASSAPLTAGNLVISGVAGRRARRQRIRRRARSGDRQGGLAVLDGAEARRARIGNVEGQRPRRSSAARATWFTGSYDPELDLVYWPVGNPSQEYNGDDRGGDNLYANCILALDRKTGRAEVALPVHAARSLGLGRDADLGGRRRRRGRAAAKAAAAREPQRLLLRVRSRRRHAAAREAVRAQPDLGQRHRRRRPADQAARTRSRRAAGTKVCPSQDGATNWFSPSYNPAPGSTTCRRSRSAASTRRPTAAHGKRASRISAARSAPAPDPMPQRVLKAIDIRTGAIRWELPQPGPATSWGGTLSTATGLVIFGEEGGALMAADAVTGRPLWSFPDQSGLEGVADDLHVRRQAAHRRRRGIHDHRVRAHRRVGRGKPPRTRALTLACAPATGDS